MRLADLLELQTWVAATIAALALDLTKLAARLGLRKFRQRRAILPQTFAPPMRRGFAELSADDQRVIALRGSSASGGNFKNDVAKAREAGRKGGQASRPGRPPALAAA